VDLNVVALTGNLTRDPELRQTGTGKSVVSLRVAVNGFGDKTSFLDLTAWDKTADIAAQYLGKGSAVAVSGRLQQREYTDKEGNKRSAVEIVVNDLKLPAKGATAAAPAEEFDF
jgi:single-strand DNA-binding protein